MASNTGSTGYTFRKFIGDLHLWLGVGSGLVLFAVCLSGTLLVFRQEIVEALNSELYQLDETTVRGQALPLAQLARTVSVQAKGKVSSIEVPADMYRAWAFTVSERGGRGERGEADERGQKGQRDPGTAEQPDHHRGPQPTATAAPTPEKQALVAAPAAQHAAHAVRWRGHQPPAHHLLADVATPPRQPSRHRHKTPRPAETNDLAVASRSLPTDTTRAPSTGAEHHQGAHGGFHRRGRHATDSTQVAGEPGAVRHGGHRRRSPEGDAELTATVAPASAHRAGHHAGQFLGAAQPLTARHGDHRGSHGSHRNGRPADSVAVAHHGQGHRLRGARPTPAAEASAAVVVAAHPDSGPPTASVAANESGPSWGKGRGEGRGGREGRGGERGRQGGHGRGTAYLVNPYTGQVLGKATDLRGSGFFSFMLDLHRRMLVERGIGNLLVGIATVIFLVLELSGLMLWAPTKLKQWRNWKMWKPGFQIKWEANWKRINHDLHNSLGFYTFGVATVLALTGLCWSFEWYRNGVSTLFGAKVFGGRNEKRLPSSLPATPSRTLSADDYLALANRRLPYPGTVRLTLPEDPASSAGVQKAQMGFFAPAAPDKLTFDQYNGALLKADIFADKPWNEQLVASIRPLHFGDVFGTSTKILYFIACLIATSLPVTGVIIWLNKLQKKRQRKPAPLVARATAPPASRAVQPVTAFVGSQPSI